MIERIHLQNFKACRDVDARLSDLTVLAGLNSSGKSSLLQAVALLRQSYEANKKPTAMLLSGDLVHLGHGRDLLSEAAEGEDDVVTLNFVENGNTYCWVCASVPEASDLQFREAPESCPHFLLTPDFQFLQANRVTPSPLYPQAPMRAHSIGFLGAQGEYTADYLALNFDKPLSENRSVTHSISEVDSGLLSMVSPTAKLLDQVSAWLQHLSPGVRLRSQRLAGTDEVLLQYNYVGLVRAPRSNDYRPTNVGFGLTYSLPIIVACLAARPGSLLLLENPEAHLHPQGQVALGELLALAASDGVQIIVETHSDHLLNGIRLAVKKARLSCDRVVLHYFTRPIETGESQIQSPSVLPDGRLSNWPKGFFDQWDKSLDALLE
jgi:predicted ATPase